MHKSVLIFGANGFVGGYLAKEFKDHSYIVYGSDRGNESKNPYLDDYYSGDLTNSTRVRNICEESKPDIIVNLAAISSVGLSWEMPQRTMEVNVNGALNILEAIRGMGQPSKVLLIGSSEEYSPLDRPLKETDATDATNPYGISKSAQGRFAEIYANRYGLKVYRARSFNHTGVGQADSFVLPSWCKQVAEIEKSGKSGVITVGNTDVSRDFTNVHDIVRAYRLFVESDHWGEVLNFGAGKAYLLSDLLDEIISFSKQDIHINIDENLIRPSDNAYICSNCEKAQLLISWAPKISMTETLIELMDSYLIERS